MTDTVHEDFLTRLRVEVADAARRVDDRALTGTAGRSPARDRRWLSAAAVLLVAALLGGVYLASSRPQPSAVQVERQGANWVFRWDEPGPDAEEVERAAEEVGLDVRVNEIPTGAYNVGRVMSFTLPQGYQGNIRREAGEDRAAGWGFRLSADTPGTVDIDLGRLALDGEAWDATVPATAPGAALACQSLLGRPLQHTLDAIARTDLRIDGFIDLSDAATLTRDVSVEQLETYAELEVISVDQVGPDSLWINVASSPVDDGQRPPPVVGC